jgi:hypothetical protein
MTDHKDWPLCQPPEPPSNCISCGEPFTTARPFNAFFGSDGTLLCRDCLVLYGQLVTAAYSDHEQADWPANYALAALDLAGADHERAAALYAALGWCDQQDSPGGTLRSLLTDGAKPMPAPAPPAVQHDWIAVPGGKTCGRCGETRYDYPSARAW